MSVKQHRLLSLDIVRGITVAGMIMVNNGQGDTFYMLCHPKWNGLTACDLVFPFFLFIMGISIFLSYSRRGFHPTASNIGKILKRTLLLFLIGVAINWLDKVLHTDLITSLEELRFWAVLQRIAVCYMLVSLFALTVRHRYALPVACSLLVIYAVILVAGGGFINEREQNILWLVDEHLLGYNHLYHYQAVDPEGLLSTISAVCNVLFGFYCASLISRRKEVEGKVLCLFTVGALLVFAGFMLHFGLPFNKRIWSPSFACITSGLCALLVALVMQWVDGRGKRGRWPDFFEVFGINALILYVSSEVIAIFFGYFGINKLIFGALQQIIPWEQIASLVYATAFMLLNWLIGYPLWRRRIIIKL
ncbi:MAG: heparan-alpha-glucosaminide N-acetyltransferase domain-containing protein [Firmicutes bacterium]|nr:heparan-alpha-glucosaminide N-acetyltransferase domain-containing protein [Bacillota bacterium]MCM1401877.1 heparan-alpha-glucosaminide N-acetyltransferase domain-containing protein [Bacteroides sp.]MCM1477920.1 heparan-alpha-glucosaminide N-acetyltransferase domain-containing protein [Bacteroides sp.]